MKKGGVILKTKKLTVEVPKKKLIRIKKREERVWSFDFRGIRSRGPQDMEKILKKNFSGEKPAFTSPENLIRSVKDYFQSCFSPVINKKGELVRDDDGEIVKYQSRPFTVSGLAYHIGVQTSTFNRYMNGQMDDLSEKDNEMLYSTILQRAKQKIEIFNEEKLYERDTFNGAKFILDHHFRKTTMKEQAEIQSMLNDIKVKEKELEMKLSTMKQDEEQQDNNITVNIVRKEG